MNYNFDLSTSPLVMREDPFHPGAFYGVTNPWIDEFPELRTVDDYIHSVVPDEAVEKAVQTRVRDGILPVRKTAEERLKPYYVAVESAMIDRIVCTRKSRNEVYADLIVDAELMAAYRTGYHDSILDGYDKPVLDWDHVKQQYRWNCMLTLEKNGLSFKAGEMELFEGSRPKRGMPLSKYLVPMMKREDPKTERKILLKSFFRDINKRQQCVRATELAGRMATVRYARLSKDGHIQGLSYPFACRIEVFDDRGNKVTMDVEPNTILIDKAACDYDSAKTEETIAHECSHLYEHCFFFALQREYYNDLESLEDLTHKVRTYGNADSRKELEIIEWQAGAVGREIVLPQDEVRAAVREVKDDIRQHGLNRYGSEPETLVNEIAVRFHSTKESAARRLMMLGEKKAGYALHLIDGHLIPYYRTTNWQPDLTYIISSRDAVREFSRNKDFREMVTDGEYIFVQNFFCRDNEKYVRKMKDRAVLTPYALNHIDECCLAFRIVFGEQDTGFDPDAMHLNTVTKQKIIAYSNMTGDQLSQGRKQHKALRKEILPMEFFQAFDHLMISRGMTEEVLSEAIDCSRKSITRYRTGVRKPNAETLTLLCVALNLDGILSHMLFQKAGIPLGAGEPDDTYNFIISCCGCNSMEDVKNMIADAKREAIAS